MVQDCIGSEIDSITYRDTFCSEGRVRFVLIRRLIYIDSLGPSDSIRRQRSGSTLAQVMACCLTAQSHYQNRTNVDLPSGRSSDIHRRTISQEIPQPSITEIIWRIKYLKYYSNFPGANELNYSVIRMLWPGHPAKRRNYDSMCCYSDFACGWEMWQDMTVNMLLFHTLPQREWNSKFKHWIMWPVVMG